MYRGEKSTFGQFLISVKFDTLWFPNKATYRKSKTVVGAHMIGLYRPQNKFGSEN